MPYYFSSVITSQTKKEGEIIIPWEMIVSLVVLYALSPLISNVRDQILVPITSHNTKKLLRLTADHLLNKLPLSVHIEESQTNRGYLLQKSFTVTGMSTPLLTQVAPKLLELMIASVALSTTYGAPIGIGVLSMSAVFTAYCALTTKPIIDANKKFLDQGGETWQAVNRAITQYKMTHDCGKSDEVMRVIDIATAKSAEAEIKMNSTPL